jgi:hypothetical protein
LRQKPEIRNQSTQLESDESTKQSTPVAPANVFPPGVVFPMLRRAGNAPHQMTDPVKIESALDFPINQVAHKRRFASFLGSGTTP